MKTRSTVMSVSGMPGVQPHVVERAPHASRRAGIRLAAGSGTRPVMGSASCGLVPQVTVGAMLRRVQRAPRESKTASGVGRQRLPVGERLGPRLALGRVAAGPPRRRRSSRRARSCPRGRPPRSTCCRPSCALPWTWPRMTGPAYSMAWPTPPPAPILAMMARITSLAVTPAGRVPVTVMRIALRLLLPEALGGQHVLDLGRADAEGERAEGSVGRGVRVAADEQ